jgi:hypothetical protein
MNTRIRIIMSGTACAVAGALALAAPSVASAADNPTAAAESQIAGPSPSSAHVWMAGHWNSEGGQWKWVAGHWDLPPSRSAVWVAGHWIQGSGGWVWVNGAWNVAEVPQSPDAPPQPPGQNPPQAVQNGNQSVPMPSTPPPYVAGQYAPGGQAPMVYQGEADTYYPPVDYSAVYPGYYWGGYPWAWGLYPGLAFGLGWGGYWGHGGWVHGRGGWHHGGSVGHAGHAVHAGAAHFGGGHWH